MKKYVVIFFALVLMGCAPENSRDEVKQPERTPSPQETGSFYTEILDKAQNRVQNLTLCASVLNGVDIAPGEIFSFNDTVGRRTKEKGYEEAAILVGDEKSCAVGGGVCQISSTLYNAANAAGMEVIERHSHSKNVGYVQKGMDAAVSWGTLDLKFKNISKNPVRIGMNVENGYVYAKIYEVK